MKRAIFAAAVAVATQASCSAPASPEARGETAAAPVWTQPPAILAVRRAQASLIFSGHAQPGARVVLRNDEGAAYAAAADDEGRFEIRMTVPSGALLLRPETQVGQDAAASPDRLLILDGGRGPIAMLRPGAAAQRLDAAPALGAIDSDGPAQLASGRTAKPRTPVVIVAGGETVRAVSGADGRWSVVLGPTSTADVIRVADQAFTWPGPGAARDDLSVERAGEGWRIGWSGPASARQWTWMPDAVER